MDNQVSEYRNDIQAADTGIPQLVACTINMGDRTFSIPLHYVKEIIEISEIYPLPLTPPYVEGIIYLRGDAIPVISLCKIMNIPEEHKKVRQLIVLELGSNKFGISINEMPDLNVAFSGEMINVKQFFESYRIAK